MVNILNLQILLDVYPQFPINPKELSSNIEQHFTLGGKELNIVFVEKLYIKELNLEYRERDEVTDVLSFSIDNNNVFGEIYICPEYVIKNFTGTKLLEEILRLIVHGILHIQGYDHSKEFDGVDYKSEPMYIKQEEILHKMLINLIQK